MSSVWQLDDWTPAFMLLLCLIHSTMSTSSGVESGWPAITSSDLRARISLSSYLLRISCWKPHSGRNTDIAYGMSHFFIRSAHRLTATLKFSWFRD